MNTSIDRDNRPFLPSDLARPDVALIRAVTVQFMAFARNEPQEAAVEIARRTWTRDTATMLLVTRAASSLTDTTAAAAIVMQAVGEFIASLRPFGGAGRLIADGVRIPLDGFSTISLPGPALFPTAPFIAEGDAYPVSQAALNAATLGPMSRIGVIVLFTRELANVAASSIESTMSALLREAGARALDSALFAATAASSLRPAGLIAGLSTLTPTTGGGVPALADDFGKLVDALVAGGAGAKPLFFMSPGRAVRAIILAPGLSASIVPAPTMPTTQVIAVDAGSFAFGFSNRPDIEISSETTLHMESAAPQGLGVSASPTLPIRSLFQTDSIGVKLNLRVSWALRSPAAFIDNPTW